LNLFNFHDDTLENKKIFGILLILFIMIGKIDCLIATPFSVWIKSSIKIGFSHIEYTNFG